MINELLIAGAVATNAVVPGNVASTALARHMGADDLANFVETTTLALPRSKTIEQGASTSVAFHGKSRGLTNHRARHHTGGGAPHALDSTNAKRPPMDPHQYDAIEACTPKPCGGQPIIGVTVGAAR